MTTITNSFRSTASCVPGFMAPSAVQQERILFGASLAFLAGGAAIALHAMHLLTAFS